MLKKISRHNRKESYSPALILFVSLLNFWLTLHFSNSIIVNERSNDPQSILALSLPSGVEALILLGLFFLASKKAKYDFSMATQRNLAFYAALCGGIATVLGYGIFENTFCKIISTGAFGLFYTVCIFAFVTRGKSFGFKKALHYLCLGAVIALLLQVIMHIGPLRGLLFGAYCITPSVITFLLFLYDARTKTNSENACSSLPQTTPSLKEMPARLFFTLCLAGAIDGFNFSIFSK